MPLMPILIKDIIPSTLHLRCGTQPWWQEIDPTTRLLWEYISSGTWERERDDRINNYRKSCTRSLVRACMCAVYIAYNQDCIRRKTTDNNNVFYPPSRLYESAPMFGQRKRGESRGSGEARKYRARLNEPSWYRTNYCVVSLSLSLSSP